MAQFYIDLASGTSDFEKLRKLYSQEEILYMLCLEEPYKSYYQTAMRIRRHHHYEPQDWDTWKDHITVLYQLGKDLHNPFYVCPDDLNATHAKYIKQLDKLREKERLIAKKKEAEMYEKQYQDDMHSFFGLLFTNEDFTISPLKTVTEFIAEGDAMHHCVYTCGYYKRKNSLILSAKDHNGNRLATIEFDLTTMQIMQCRGLCNAKPEFDEEIRKCIQLHTKDIMKAKNKRLRKTA